MSETQSRPSGTRGRGSHRGGRGGFRGGRGSGKPTKTEEENIPPAAEGNREIFELKKKHGSKVTTVKEMFPNWTDEDIVYALEDAGGDLEGTVERITSGSTGQWGEVAKKTDKTRSKPKDTQAGHEAGTRGSRGRGGTEGRARGRGDRGRGSRGGRGSNQTNGTRTERVVSTQVSEPAVEAGWGDTAPEADTTDSWADAATNGDNAADGWGTAESSKPKPKTEEPKSTIIPSSKVSNWAGLFAKPPPEPPKKAPSPPPIAAVETPPPVEDSFTPAPILQTPAEASTNEPPSDSLRAIPSEPAINVTPSKDELTHDNLEHIPDVSQPIASATAASTVASTQDPNNVNSAQPSIRPGMSGYAASALKATTSSGRTASFQRRVLEQQEAVVMPENHAVSRAAMQFGSMNIGDEQGGLDEDREEPETRTQLPDDSPVAPRASLPKTAPPAQAAAEPPTAPKAAPGLPPAPQQQVSTSPPQNTSYADQFSRYGQASQKGYDAFGQQSQQQQASQHSGPPAQENLPSQTSSQGQTSSAAAPGDYAAYYGQDAQRAYQNFYGYNQNQEVQQRSGSAFGTAAESQSQYATSRPQAGVGSQEAANSGHNTPNPTQAAQQPQQPAQSMHQGQASHGGYPYGYANAGYNQPYPQYASYMSQMNQDHQYGGNRPMFDDARRYDQSQMSYNNQYGSYGGRQQQQQYGGGHYNKSAAMYGQPQHQYSSYEHSSSPANAGPLSQTSAGREASYARTGSAQPESQQASSSSAFGGMTDPFSREQSNFGSHTPMSQQHAGQMSLEDHSKSYDASNKSVPSPQVKNAAHRPASAANNMQAHPQASSQQQPQSSFPAPQQTGNQQQAAFGNYPQYTGFGGNVGGGAQPSQQHQHQQQQGHSAAGQGQGNHPGQNAQQQQQQQYGYGSGAGGGFGSYGAAGGYGAGAGRGWTSSYGAGH